MTSVSDKNQYESNLKDAHSSIITNLIDQTVPDNKNTCMISSTNNIIQEIKPQIAYISSKFVENSNLAEESSTCIDAANVILEDKENKATNFIINPQRVQVDNDPFPKSSLQSSNQQVGVAAKLRSQEQFENKPSKSILCISKQIKKEPKRSLV